MNKNFTVFRVYDGLHGSAKDLHAVAVKHTTLVQFHATVERRLSAERQENTVRAFLGYDTLYEIGRHGQEVYLVGNALRGLHCGYVGIDKHGLKALFPEGLECLAAGVVKFSCFAYL